MSVAERLAEVRARIADACRKAGRAPGEVRVLAVTKTQPAAAAEAARVAGADGIAENRVQEAATKRPEVTRGLPWHLIGPLQRNKAALALELFDVVQTIDRVELADRLERLLAGRGEPRVLPVFIEVNVSGEAQKTGVAPAALPPLADHLRGHCPHLKLAGLMTVPAFDTDPERARPAFAALRELALRIAEPGQPLELSMGMSGDYEVAVAEGATWVRLGTALFGERRIPR